VPPWKTIQGAAGTGWPGRLGSGAGNDVHACDALAFPNGLCPEDADIPDGPSPAPTGRWPPGEFELIPLFLSAAAALIAPTAPTLDMPTPIPLTDIPPIPIAAAGVENASTKTATSDVRERCWGLRMSFTSRALLRLFGGQSKF
jgi:hypothetical protein